MVDYQHLPAKPGVYIFRDADGQILYVGKAINLRSRVGSYFSGTDPLTSSTVARNGSLGTSRPWTAVMIGLIKNIETIVVSNEVEALMLEATLIRQHQPKFNIKLADDRSYPLIKLTVNEPLPRLQVVRHRSVGKGRYFGPYLSGRTAKVITELLRQAYGVHISNRPLRPSDRRCFNCQLADRPCPLCGEISVETYQEGVKEAIDFLEGRQQTLTRLLKKQMAEAVKTENFEQAGRLRDQLQAARLIAVDQNVISTALDDYDAIGVALNDRSAVVVILNIRQGQLVKQSSHNFATGHFESVGEVIRQFIIGFYPQLSELPVLTVIPVELDDQETIERWLRDQAGHRYELRVAKRGRKRRLSELARENAEQILETKLLSFNRSYSGIIALKELLKLDFLPERIEAVDISNLGASETVGATVCFINGQPVKEEYRRYKIRTVEGQNDFAMIAEVVGRRCADSSRPLPDLLVIDGGPEQLRAAARAIRELRIMNQELGKKNGKPSILSLAKKPDRIFRPGRKLPLSVSRGDKGLLLLGRIRDEVHRFAVSYHRIRQAKKSLHE